MRIHLALGVLAFIATVAPPLLPTPIHAVACGDDTDTCVGQNSSIVAISHSFNNPENEVLFRVRVAAWSPGAKWGDGANGFFYRVTRSSGSTLIYTPFNGISIGDDGLPSLPTFTFIVPVTGAADASIAVQACASERAFGSGEDPACTKSFWSDEYAPLPLPLQTAIPPVNVPSTVSFTFDQSSLVIADSGVYSGRVVMTVRNFSTPLTEEQIAWLDDHLVFFDAQGNALTNDIYGRTALGILPLEDAAFLNPGDQQYYTKYAAPNDNPIAAQDSPNRTYFVYATGSLPAATTIGLTVIYDASEDCTGILPNNGTKNPNCTSGTITTGDPDVSPALQVTATDLSPVNDAVAQQAPGQQRRRVVDLRLSPTAAQCTEVVNPLGLASATAVGTPNYVIGDGLRFPRGLYYVLGTGFGNCDLTNHAPFCDQTPNYVAYVPHYQDRNAVGGNLNGGGTASRIVAQFALADQYAIAGTSGATTTNAVVFFDNCGYWFTYTEPNSTVSAIDTRLTLPSAPSGWSKQIYTVENLTGGAVILLKECCASWYQPNSQTQANEPAQQLDDGFGVFIPVGGSVQYESFFRDEATAVYDAATGTPLFKLRLNGNSSHVYSCSDPNASVVASGNSVKLGATGSGSKTCTAIGKCPLGMSAAQSGSLVTCSRTQSSFLFGLDDWRAETKLPNRIQLLTFGGTGRDARNGDGQGGAHGIALTVVRPSDLPDALYAYVGMAGSDHGDGGSSSILTTTPLSFYGEDTAEDTDNPADMNVWLIAGGGGGDGTKHNGGSAPPARANNTSVPGPAVSLGGQNGFNDNGGKGGNGDGVGTHGSTAGSDGVGGTSHSQNADWDRSGPLIPPTVDPLEWGAGHGGHGNSSAGGGGFGGGGHGSTNAAGGGGGGGWARGNTVYDSTAPTGRPASPGGANGGVEIAYVAPTASVVPAPLTAANAAGASTSTLAAERNVVRFTFQHSATPLHLPIILSKIFGDELSGDVPVHIEAWGGDGGAGGASGRGGGGGAGGYSRASYRLADLAALNADGSGLYIYVGEQGADGDGLGEPGQGGASSVVSTVPIASAGTGDGIVVIAGGAGGGGAATSADDPSTQSGGGGDGGSAESTLAEGASCAGSEGGGTGEGELGGGGGNGGGGTCGSPAAGSGGASGIAGGMPGSSGIGGFGGVTGAVSLMPRWREADVGRWATGEGAASPSLGGAGGGGYGGGGSGGESLARGEGGGGGGGGSWARQSSLDGEGAPIVGRHNPSAPSGAVTLTLDVCAVHPELHYCTAQTDFAEIHPQVRTFEHPDGLLHVRIHGDDGIDVGQLDGERFAFGHAMVGPVALSETADMDGNGTEDLEILVDPRDVPAANGKPAVHCVYGATSGGAPFVGCSRVEAAACMACAREECEDGVCPREVALDEEDDDDGCAVAAPRSTHPITALILIPALVLIALRTRRRDKASIADEAGEAASDLTTICAMFPKRWSRRSSRASCTLHDVRADRIRTPRRSSVVTSTARSTARLAAPPRSSSRFARSRATSTAVVPLMSL